MNLSWTTSANAAGYRLYELENGQPTLIATYTASTTAAAVGGLKPATVYSFNLVAFSGTSTAATPWISVATAGGVSAPGNFSGAAVSNTQIGLSWTTASGATGYKLYELENGAVVLIATYGSSATSATVSGLAAGTTYQFNLVAFNNNSTAATPWISVTTTGGIAPPGSFSGTPFSDSQVSLSWATSANATGYKLYELENGTPVQIATYAAGTTAALVNGLKAATTYQFNLVAFNGNVTAATPWISVTTTGGVTAPGSFSGTALSNTQVGLTWIASPNATGYRLYQLENGTPVLIATYFPGTTSATVSGLQAATTYQFNLVAFNANATAATPWISVTTTGALQPPGSFSGTAVSNTQIALSWTTASGAAGYRLYQMEGGAPVLIATYGSSATSSTVSGLTPGTTYQFNLVAFSGNMTAATPWISVSTTGGLAPPGSFSGTPVSDTQVALSWTTSANATGYRLYEMENGTPVLISTYSAGTTSATVNGLTPSTTYQFNLVAFNGSTTAATPWISVTTTGGVTAPGNFAGTSTVNTVVTLSWTASNNATGYRLYELENGAPVLIATYNVGTTSAAVGGLKAATTYQFNLVAFNANSTAATPWTSVTTAGGVSPPGNFSGTAINGSQIGLSWTTATGATGYRLYELEHGAPVLIATYAAGTTSVAVNGLKPATAYSFNLVAFNTNATAATAWITVPTAGGVSPPGNFAGNAISNSQISLGWTAATGATGYRLYQLINNAPVLIATYGSSITSTTINGLSASTSYSFNLVAFNTNATAATPWITVATTA
jgi:hypothetical protein